jgi:hypothetical protein
MTKEQGDEFLKALKQIVSQQPDLAAMASMLNACLGASAPRALSETQAKRLQELLSPYRGQKVRISSYDPEGKSYAESFVPVFERAGWVQGSGEKPGVAMILGYTGSTPVGVQVTINKVEAEAGRAPNAAFALLDAMIELHATADEKKTMYVNEHVEAGVIELRVGIKPPIKLN